MSGCLDKVDCRCSCDCDCWQGLKDRLTPKRNMLASVVSGILFSAGWWAVIDGFTEHVEPIYASYFISGILSTIALLMINAVSTGQVTGDAYTEGCLGRKGARAWLFVGFALAFGGLISSLWIFVQQFIVPAVTCSPTIFPPSNNTNATFDEMLANTTTTTTILPAAQCIPYWWQGSSVFIQNILIFLSALVFKFGRTEEDGW
ncbi:transmembrane protein 50A-like [Halichondria panicea]|uniref:transmembrane protein 50A-like n=1 Tax=Halichondria panicea TaxID=6063 RepID=UPI00312B4298